MLKRKDPTGTPAKASIASRPMSKVFAYKTPEHALESCSADLCKRTASFAAPLYVPISNPNIMFILLVCCCSLFIPYGRCLFCLKGLSLVRLVVLALGRWRLALEAARPPRRLTRQGLTRQRLSRRWSAVIFSAVLPSRTTRAAHRRTSTIGSVRTLARRPAGSRPRSAMGRRHGTAMGRPIRLRVRVNDIVVGRRRAAHGHGLAVRVHRSTGVSRRAATLGRATRTSRTWGTTAVVRTRTTVAGRRRTALTTTAARAARTRRTRRVRATVSGARARVGTAETRARRPNAGAG